MRCIESLILEIRSWVRSPLFKTTSVMTNTLLGACLVSSATGQDKDLPPKLQPQKEEVVDLQAVARMQSDIAWIASDEMGGRGVDTEGLKRAGEFIANRWKELGFQVDAFDGTPYQDFTLPGPMRVGATEKNKLLLTSPDGESVELQLGSDFTPVSLGSNGTFEGELAFAGYGITAKDPTMKLDYDDYQSFDPKGKVVIVIRKEPQQNDDKSLFAGKDPSDFSFYTTKQANAASHGVAAMIMVNDGVTASSANGDQLPPADGAGRSFGRKRVPTLFAKREVIDRFLKKATGKGLADYESEIDKDLVPRSQVLSGWQVKGEAETGPSKVPVRNVLAVLPGKGDLASEYVVVGAHYDHVGMGGVGSLAPGTIAVHNGADDNGSGTVALLEVSRRLTTSLPTDAARRTVVFIAFTAEEMGLLGSAHYVRSPRFPLEQTVAMVNMDMVGRLANNILTVYGTGTAKEFDGMIERLNERYQFDLDKSPEGYGPSDHQSFYEKKIPVFHFFTGLHGDYHRPSDDFDKINVTGMVRITDMVNDVVVQLATQKVRPEYVAIRGSANPRQQAVRRGRLQISLVAGTEPIVESVEQDGVAQKAGIESGDRIVRLGDKPIDSLERLREFMEQTSPGQTISVEVVRNGEKKKFEVRLAK